MVGGSLTFPAYRDGILCLSPFLEVSLQVTPEPGLSLRPSFPCESWCRYSLSLSADHDATQFLKVVLFGLSK